jgi:hypothetical protein
VARSKALTVTIHIDGLRETLAAFRRLPPEASEQLRIRSLQISEVIASRVRSAAHADSGQAALMAPTVKARRDRVPAVAAGGSVRVGRNRKPAFKVLFGSEFGSNHLRQFRPHLGRGSYWFFRTVEENEDWMASAWRRAADDVIAAFTRSV